MIAAQEADLNESCSTGADPSQSSKTSSANKHSSNLYGHLDPKELIERVTSKEIDPNSLDECCICLERKPDVILPCTHSYCLSCIEQWNVDHKTCITFSMNVLKVRYIITAVLVIFSCRRAYGGPQVQCCYSKCSAEFGPGNDACKAGCDDGFGNLHSFVFRVI